MYDRGKIIPALVVFVLLATSPLWWNLARGAGPRPQPEPPAGESKCVEDRAYMAANHMKLLYGWRDAVVREGRRLHRSGASGEHEMSLTKTCLKCHANKETFCDRCHDYADVQPDCWTCHVDPKGN